MSGVGDGGRDEVGRGVWGGGGGEGSVRGGGHIRLVVRSNLLCCLLLQERYLYLGRDRFK